MKCLNNMDKLDKILNPKKLKEWLEKNVGKRCKDYDWDCYVCRSWRLYDEIDSYVNFNDIILLYNLRGNKVRPHTK